MVLFLNMVSYRINGIPTYVAQTYLKDFGLYIGYIQDQQTNISINTGLSKYAPLNYSDLVKVSLFISNII